MLSFPTTSVTTDQVREAIIVPFVVAPISILNIFCPDTSVISVQLAVAVPESDISPHVKLLTSIGSENVAVKCMTPVAVSGSDCVEA